VTFSQIYKKIEGTFLNTFILYTLSNVHKEEIYKEISQQYKYDIHQTSIICSTSNKVYFKVNEFKVMNSIKNSDLQLTMMVKKDDFKMDWFEMKIPLYQIVDLAFIHHFFLRKMKLLPFI
jgi:hypothetical protein